MKIALIGYRGRPGYASKTLPPPPDAGDAGGRVPLKVGAFCAIFTGSGKVNIYGVL